MEFVTVEEELQRLQVEGDWGKIAQLSEMFQAFPTLRLFRDHWGILRACAAEANQEVDRIVMDSCHTCDGKPIKLWTYAEIDSKGTRLYSDPPMFVVADQNQKGFGEIPRPDWEEELKSHGIGRFVITKVREHLRGHPPINYFEDADDQGEGSQGTGS